MIRSFNINKRRGKRRSSLIPFRANHLQFQVAQAFSKLNKKHSDYKFQKKCDSFQHYKKNSGGLETVLEQIEVNVDKPNTYTADIV